MAERKAKPVAKKVAVTKAAGKPNTAKAVEVPKKAVVKKAAIAAVKPQSTKTPIVKKTAAPAAVTKAPTQKAVASSVRPVAKKAMASPTPEERYRMVQTAAYFIAERNGFCGCPTEYWAAAEIEIADRLG